MHGKKRQQPKQAYYALRYFASLFFAFQKEDG
jgi:hypothetical protein